MTALLQPMDKGIIHAFKLNFIRHTYRILDALNADPEQDLVDCWKNFNIADFVSCIKYYLDGWKESTLISCCKKLHRLNHL